MKYRRLSLSGDYQFGRPGLFHIDTPDGVAQAIRTRLALWTGEWFLDQEEGTPYLGAVIGHGTQGTRDLALKERITQTPGVLELLEYASSVDSKRKMTVTARVSTIYGQTTISLEA